MAFRTHRLILALLLICFWIGNSPGQNIESSDQSSGVTIRKYKWQQVGPGPGVDSSWKAESDGARTDSGSASSSDDSPSFAVRRGPFFLYSLEVQNVGSKPIKAIRWDYIILDSKTNEELGTHEFENIERISPNKVKALNAKSPVSPTRVVPVQETDKSATTEKVVVRCVVYEDGTLWKQSAVSEPACEALRRRAQN